MDDLEDEKAWEEGKIGINSLEQLTWKQGLDLYSCTECGRCYDVCPTYVTGKPLTEMDQPVSARHLREGRKYLSDRHLQWRKILVGDVIHPEALWACTTCRACEDLAQSPLNTFKNPWNATGADHDGRAYPPEISSAYKGLEEISTPGEWV